MIRVSTASTDYQRVHYCQLRQPLPVVPVFILLPVADIGFGRGVLDQERPSSSQQRHPGSHPYIHPGPHYSMPHYYGGPMMYYPPPTNPHDQHCHYYVPSNYNHHHPTYTQEPREQVAPYSPPPREGQAHANHATHALGSPNYQPHYVAVNVQNDLSQLHNQHQNQAASNKQVSLKQKVIHNTTKALDSILDRKILMAAFTAFLAPRFLNHLQTVSEKKKRKGLTLSLGFGGL